MKFGLCLSGGGAKGAFEAGAIEAMINRDIYPEIISGTSIGAVNAFFLINSAYKELKELWTQFDESEFNLDIVKLCKSGNKVIENDYLLHKLKGLKENKNNVEKAYVNYVEIKKSLPEHKIVEIANLPEDKKIDHIKASSLLPMNSTLLSFDEARGEEVLKYDTSCLFEQFKVDLKNGIYDGYSLDGGIISNTLLEPFIEDIGYKGNKVDNLIIIALHNDYQVPDFLLEHYSHDEIIVVEPEIKIMPEDTIKFTREFCGDMYKSGFDTFNKIMRNKYE